MFQDMKKGIEYNITGRGKTTIFHEAIVVSMFKRETPNILYEQDMLKQRGESTTHAWNMSLPIGVKVNTRASETARHWNSNFVSSYSSSMAESVFNSFFFQFFSHLSVYFRFLVICSFERKRESERVYRAKQKQHTKNRKEHK